MGLEIWDLRHCAQGAPKPPPRPLNPLPENFLACRRAGWVKNLGQFGTPPVTFKRLGLEVWDLRHWIRSAQKPYSGPLNL